MLLSFSHIYIYIYTHICFVSQTRFFCFYKNDNLFCWTTINIFCCKQRQSNNNTGSFVFIKYTQTTSNDYFAELFSSYCRGPDIALQTMTAWSQRPWLPQALSVEPPTRTNKTRNKEQAIKNQQKNLKNEKLRTKHNMKKNIFYTKQKTTDNYTQQKAWK